MKLTRPLNSPILVVFTALSTACGGASNPGLVPNDAAIGDELVATVTPLEIEGAWDQDVNVGAMVRLKLGENRARDLILPGDAGVKIPAQRVAVGAWDGGAFVSAITHGEARVEITLDVVPDASGAPLLGIGEQWQNDTPLAYFRDEGADGTTTWNVIQSGVDTGIGIMPTLMMARNGRIAHIVSIWLDEGDSFAYRETTQNWTSFNGQWEGSHPILSVSEEGAFSTKDSATYWLSPYPTDFSTDQGSLPRAQILDALPFISATAFAEMSREDKRQDDGGPGNLTVGGPDDYLFVDYQTEPTTFTANDTGLSDSADTGSQDSDSVAAPTCGERSLSGKKEASDTAEPKVEKDTATADDTGVIGTSAFYFVIDACVNGEWISSTNGYPTDGGLTDTTLSGVGRAAIELPPGTDATDVTNLRLKLTQRGAGLVTARWFHLGEDFLPIELGALETQQFSGLKGGAWSLMESR